jgi:hypothetical protein
MCALCIAEICFYDFSMVDYHQINRFWGETCRNLFGHRKKNCCPLTAKQWKDAFDAETGRLLNGDRILQSVRHGVRNFFFFFFFLHIDPNFRF